MNICTVYFFRHNDCDVCKKAEPILDAWWVRVSSELKSKAAELNMPPTCALWVVKLDTTYGAHDSYKDFRPKGTPAYLITINDQTIYKSVGGLREKDLDKIWDKILKGTS